MRRTQRVPRKRPSNVEEDEKNVAGKKKVINTVKSILTDPKIHGTLPKPMKVSLRIFDCLDLLF